MTMHEAKKLGVLALLGLAVLVLFWNPEMLSTMPTGFSSNCPNCLEVSGQTEPNHSYILPVVLLLIAIVGAHSLSDLSSKITAKKCLTFASIPAVFLLALVFGLSIASPTGQATIALQKISSIIAAFGVIFVFGVGAFEAVSHQDDGAHNWDEDKEW